MNTLSNVLNLDRVAFALVHSVWQMAVIGALTMITLKACGRGSARIRYAIAYTSLLLSAGSFAATWAFSGDTGLRPEIDHRASGLVQPLNLPAEAIGAPRDAGWHTPSALRLLAALWVAGVFLLACMHVVGWFRLQSLRNRAVIFTENAIEAVARRSGLRRPPLVATCDTIGSPITFGAWRPIVLMPVAIMAELSVEQLQAILAHEFAHIRRRDYLQNLIQVVIETLLFYHPAIWWIGGVVRREREFCCDDRAAEVVDRQVYAQALLRLESVRSPVLCQGAAGASLLERVQRLARHQPRGQRALAGFVMLVTITAIGCAIALARVSALGDDSPPNVGPSTDPVATTQPVTPDVYEIGGLVDRVGVYTLPNSGESRTLLGAIRLAGGLRDEVKAVYLFREEGKPPKMATRVFSPEGLTNGTEDDPKLLANDKISVRGTDFIERRGPTIAPDGNYSVEGEVSRPGKYALTQPGRVDVIDALRAAGVLQSARWIEVWEQRDGVSVLVQELEAKHVADTDARPRVLSGQRIVVLPARRPVPLAPTTQPQK